MAVAVFILIHSQQSQAQQKHSVCSTSSAAPGARILRCGWPLLKQWVSEKPGLQLASEKVVLVGFRCTSILGLRTIEKKCFKKN